ncbi:alcohol dehydrogenase catalytic domain-containing protein, partial [Kibdelosporangium lantanae]
MKAIVAMDRAADAGGITLVERPEPVPAINDVVVEVHASGFVPAEWEWPSTWVDRSGNDRTQAVIGHEFAGVVTSLGYGTTGLSLGQRVYGALVPVSFLAALFLFFTTHVWFLFNGMV